MTRLPRLFRVRSAGTRLPWEFEPGEAPRARLLAHYLVHSCIYYELGRSIISDHEFDELASMLYFYREEPSICGHEHARLIDWDMLANGSSGFYLKFDSRIRGCAEWLLNKNRKSK